MNDEEIKNIKERYKDNNTLLAAYLERLFESLQYYMDIYLKIVRDSLMHNTPEMKKAVQNSIQEVCTAILIRVLNC